MVETELTNKQLVEELQKLGVENINPGANKTQLKEMLDEAVIAKGPQTPGENPVSEGPLSDMAQLMAAIGGIAKSLDSVVQRVDKIETGGKNDFMNEIKQSDVDSANDSKKHADPRVVQIVEETLGIDFGVNIEPNPNSPGFQFTVLVPKRLSPIENSTRPILDPEVGTYKVDPKTQLPIEEIYWPGDRRSRAIGSTDSFDVIRDHCNKVRAHIVTYYEKLKKPLPEFKLKN